MPMPRNIGPYWSNARFIARLVAGFAPNGDCLEWQGYVMPEGYGQIGYGDKLVILTHRAVWAVKHGQEVPEGMDVCHTCDNRRCGRDEHLFLGTRLNNMEDARSKGRTLKGGDNRAARLAEAQVRNIMERVAAGEQHKRIAAEYHVSRQTVSDIARRKSWAHLW